MDLQSLNIFIQVAELNSFTKAGEKLGYSQPTISFQIKQLEAELGVQLFDRFGHNVSLTQAGREALTYAQKICQLSEEMVADSNHIVEPNGLVHIAMADSLCNPLVGNKFEQFRKSYPYVSLKVTTAGTDDLFDLLDHNEADIVCTLDSHIYDTNYKIIHEEKVGVHIVVSSSHPLANKTKVTIHDLMNESFMLTEKGMSYRRLLDENLARHSLEIHPVLEIGSADMLCRLVEENAGISFLPDYVTESSVCLGKIKRLHVEEVNVDVWKQVLHHKDKWVSTPMKALFTYLSESL